MVDKKRQSNKYGNRKGSSPYARDILPIIAEIIKPGQKIAELYRQMLPICSERNIKPPCAKTLERLVKASGLSTQFAKQRVITTLHATITVDTQNPLNSLLQLAAFIQDNPAFSQSVKEHSVRQLKNIIKAVSRKSPLRLHRPLTEEEIATLECFRVSQHKGNSARATALLLLNQEPLLLDVVNATGYTPSTVHALIHRFKRYGIGFVEVKPYHPERDKRVELRTNRIIDIIHTPPGAFGVNRTTWTYGAITKVYAERYDEAISVKTVERAVRQSGCTWRRVRRIQTSTDPEYRQKIEHLLDVLQGLKEGERFFFIDEVGPYRVRRYGGRVLMTEKCSAPVLPEHQKSRGKVQFVAALEAVTNQLKWIFTADKSAASMVMLLESIAREYTGSPAIYLTWDAISVHSSKTVNDWIISHNSSANQPRIEVVPLPSHAQFLNVIESVFCGMKKAVICNSDYATPHDMQQAIATHFETRNAFYKENPKRAGNKIWDKQRFDFDKLAGGIFKKM